MSRQRPIPAKLTRPRPYAALARERLFAMLDAHRNRPAVWIAAPPGAGKTTLVASYVEARGLASLWYQLDADDADPAAFFGCLRQAARPWIGRRRVALPQFSPAHQADLAGFARRWFRALFGLLPDGALLVIDNFQDAAGAVGVMLREAAGQVPAHVNLVVLSRDAPPAEFAPLLAGQQLTVLAGEALRLTFEETAAVAAGAERALDDAALHALHALCDGWAAGIVLMRERLRQTGTLDAANPGDTAQAVFDYFAAQLFDRLPVRHQRTLARTALLPHATPAQARAISGDAHAPALLDDFYRRQLFVERRAQPLPVYHFHALFRAFLHARARVLHSPAGLAQLARRAARLLADAGQPQAAAALLCEAGNAPALADLVRAWAPSLLKQGRHQTLVGWLAQLPPQMVDADAWLCHWQGAADQPFDPARSRRRLERAFALFDTARDRAGLLSSWAGVVESIALDPNADAAQFDRWIAALDALVACDPTYPSEVIEYRVASAMYGALCARRPWHPQFGAWRQRALALARAAPAGNPRVMTLYAAVHAELRAGHLAKAQLELAAAPPPDAADLFGLARAMAYSTRAFLEHATGRHEACLASVAAGLEAARATGVRFGELYLNLQGAHAALLSGDLDEAERWLQAFAEGRAPVVRGRACHYHYVAGWLALMRGEQAAAARHAELNLERSAGWWFIEAWAHSLSAAVWHQAGHAQRATRHLATMLAIGRRCGSHWVVYSGLLTQAQFAFAAGDEPAGLAALRAAMALGRAQGLASLPRHGPSAALADLCERALQAGIETDYVRAVIRSHRLAPGSQTLEQWPWPVRLFTLGRFGLLVNDRPVEFGRKAPRKPLALLGAIVALGGKGVADTRLAAALWPDLDGDAAHQALASALHRLRRLLGRDDAVGLHDGHVTLDPRVCWVDAWAFQRLAGEADRAAGAAGAQAECTLSQRALALYGGGFLPDETDQAWTVPLRERLHSLFVRRVLALAQRLQACGDDDAALAWYRRGIEVDALVEAFHVGLMGCHLRQGRHAEGLAAYRRLRQALSVMLGIAPSAAAQSLHAALISVATAPPAQARIGTPSVTQSA